MRDTPTIDDWQRRKLDQTLVAANRALVAMRKGQTLRLQYQSGRPFWFLSNGKSLTVAVAAIVISNASVVPADDALFAGLPGQNWRYRHV